MIVQPIRTKRISPRMCTLTELLDEVLTELPPGTVLAITSKIVSLCEGAVVPIEGTDKELLIREEADLRVTDAFREQSKYGSHFTIIRNTLISSAGIDESNGGGVYVLWPRDPQATATMVRHYLVKRFGHTDVGVVITDSASRPLRRGASGIALAFSGFKPLHNYVGEPDLFGRLLKVEHGDIAGGLAATAVLVMGEGAESTPLALIQDVPSVEFVDREPSEEELVETRIAIEDDLFAPFLQSAEWIPGGHHQRH